MKGLCRKRHAEKEITLNNNSKEALKRRAEASFKKEEPVREGPEAKLEYEAEDRAVGEKTARLRALRLAKKAAENV
jgi:hypothetical protein